MIATKQTAGGHIIPWIVGWVTRNVHQKVGSKLLTMMPPEMRNFSTVVNANGVFLTVFTGESGGRRMYYYGDFENHQVSVFLDLVDDATVLYDIGTNIGYYSLLAAKKGARVFSFEPCKEMLELLATNIQLNNLSDRITVIAEAVSDKEGTVMFYPHREGNFGVGKIFRELNEEPTTKLASAAPTEVRTRPLESYFREVGMPTLIKMDIEGAEYFILSNLPKSLSRDDAPTLFIEFHLEAVASLGGSVQQLRDNLRSFGYRIFRVRGTPLVEQFWEVYSKKNVLSPSLVEIFD